MAIDLFRDILPSILLTGIDVLEDEKDYNPFILNRAISLHYDCILYAEEMNLYPGLDKRMQYDFLRYALRKYKRKYTPWLKREKTEDLELISDYYQCSFSKAREYIRLLTFEQIKEIKEKMDRGGVKK